MEDYIEVNPAKELVVGTILGILAVISSIFAVGLLITFCFFVVFAFSVGFVVKILALVAAIAVLVFGAAWVGMLIAGLVSFIVEARREVGSVAYAE